MPKYGLKYFAAETGQRLPITMLASALGDVAGLADVTLHGLGELAHILAT